jgi:hypothetical protein
MSKNTEPKFTPESFGDPDQLLKEAARLTLRLALRCEWVEGCEDKDDDDPDSWNDLYDSIGTLFGAYVRNPEGENVRPDFLLARFAAKVADVIAEEPSLRAAVAAHLATKQDSDP